MMWKVRYLVLIIVISIISTVSFIYFSDQFQVRNYAVPIRYKDLKRDTKIFHTKTILFWTKFFSYPFWLLPEEVFQEGYLQADGCSYINCMFTLNRSYLSHPHDYDAIMFHTAEVRRDLNDIPETRKPRQVYIMVSKELEFLFPKYFSFV